MACNMTAQGVDLTAYLPGEDGKYRGDDPIGLQGGGLRYMLDDIIYPDDEIPIVFNDGGGTVRQWMNSDPERPCTISVAPTAGILSGPALSVYSPYTGVSVPYQVTYFNNRNLTGAGLNSWWKLKQFLESTHGVTIPPFRLNRLRFWVFMPEVQPFSEMNGGTNFHVGTYCRRTGASTVGNESDNWHFYHYLNLGYSGNWHQVILDTHPTHQRSAAGASDVGDKATLQPDGNYIDHMTYFYLSTVWQAISTPATFLFDKFELFEDTNADADTVNVYNITGVKFNSVANRIRVGWSRRRDDNAAVFNVRYAYTSFQRNGGFGHGVAAPAGSGLTGFGNPYGENTCIYQTEAIDLTGRDVLYIAVQRQGQSGYREICIPLNDAGYAQMGMIA